MKSKVKQAALKILLIQEEYSASEIDEAIKLIKDDSEAPALITYLASGNYKSQHKVKSKKSQKSISEQTSKVVLELKESDPVKFSLLSEFDSLLRKGLILKKLNDIKTFASGLSKEFPETKGRRDAIPKLVALLAELPNEKIKELVEKALTESKLSPESSEYQELAQFLIHGSKI